MELRTYHISKKNLNFILSKLKKIAGYEIEINEYKGTISEKFLNDLEKKFESKAKITEIALELKDTDIYFGESGQKEDFVIKIGQTILFYKNYIIIQNYEQEKSIFTIKVTKEFDPIIFKL